MWLELLNITDKPSNVAVGAARTCYYPNGIVRPESCEGWGAKTKLLSSIFEAGHHTTLQHTHLTFLISGMSRHLIWRLLHSHAHYNSEQVSQRYAKMKPDAFVYPQGCDKKEWESFYDKIFIGYEQLCTMLTPIMSEKLPKFKKGEAVKKAQELARYILPGGMGAYLYHTVNLMTALRYISAASALPEAKGEAMEFAGELEKILLELDDALLPIIQHAKSSPASFPRFDMYGLKKRLDIKNETVKVFDITTLGGEAVDGNYADVMRMSAMFHDSAAIGSFSSYIRLSLSADAQNQRHRKSPAVRPRLEENYTKDAYIPPVIAENPQLLAVYEEYIAFAYDFFESQKKALGFGESVYALPNAHNIEIVEKNDLSSFHHKAQMRLCYNAQQEIFDVVYEQTRQLREKNIDFAQEFLPPCSVRQKFGIFPTCPEGSRFCGVKVWKQPFEKMTREF